MIQQQNLLEARYPVPSTFTAFQENTLKGKQPGFDRNSPRGRETAHPSIRCQDPVTGYDERNRISGQGMAYSPGCAGTMDDTGYVTIGQGAARLDIPAGGKHLPAKDATAVQIDRNTAEILNNSLYVQADSLHDYGYKLRNSPGLLCLGVGCDGLLGLFLGLAGELQEDKDRWTVFCFRLPPGYSAHAKRGIKNTKEWAIHSCIPPGSGIIVRLIPGSAEPVRKGASCQRQNPALPATDPERTVTRAAPHPIRPYI